MILSENFLKLHVQAMNLYSLICGQLFTFDVKRQKIVILDKPGAMLGLKARNVLLLVVSITSFTRVIKLLLSDVHIDNSNNTAVEINISIMLIVVNIAASEYYRLRRNYPEDFVTFMNGAMGIEKKYRNGVSPRTSVKSKLAKLVLRATPIFAKYTFSYGMAVACAIDNSLSFNTAWTLEYLVGLWNFQSLALKILLKISLITFNYINWTLMTIQGYKLVVDMLIGVLSLGFCQDYAHRYISNELRRMRTLPKESRSSDPTDSVIIYLREIHILAEMCNHAMRSLFFFVLLAIGVAQIVAAVSLIRPEPLPFLVALFFASVTIDATLMILVVYGIAGGVYDDSKKALLKQNRLVRSLCIGNSKRERKYFLRFLASCQTTKIRFGLSNFIEKNTPPIIQLFGVQRIADVALLLSN